MYGNISKLRIIKQKILTLIELKLQDFMGEIQKLNDNPLLLFTQILVNNNWEYYFPGLNTIDWNNAKMFDLGRFPPWVR
jgi:hypothetical protein